MQRICSINYWNALQAMKKNLDIDPKQLKLILDILQYHLPPDAIVWVFGSRATGTAKKFSDLDLAIDIGKPLALEIMAKLANSFEESNLPYKVDLIDWQTISDSFRRHIEKDRVVLWPEIKL